MGVVESKRGNWYNQHKKNLRLVVMIRDIRGRSVIEIII